MQDGVGIVGVSYTLKNRVQDWTFVACTVVGAPGNTVRVVGAGEKTHPFALPSIVEPSKVTVTLLNGPLARAYVAPAVRSMVMFAGMVPTVTAEIVTVGVAMKETFFFVVQVEYTIRAVINRSKILCNIGMTKKFNYEFKVKSKRRRGPYRIRNRSTEWFSLSIQSSREWNPYSLSLQRI